MRKTQFLQSWNGRLERGTSGPDFSLDPPDHKDVGTPRTEAEGGVVVLTASEPQVTVQVGASTRPTDVHPKDANTLGRDTNRHKVGLSGKYLGYSVPNKRHKSKYLWNFSQCLPIQTLYKKSFYSYSSKMIVILMMKR